MKLYVALDASDQPPQPVDLVWVCGDNLRTGADELTKQVGNLTTLEEDLLRVVSSIFASDLACKRGQREAINRTIELSIPVVNHAALNAERQLLERILHILSDDNWTLQFRRVTGSPEDKQSWPDGRGKTLLFSGGLDSFAGAVDLLDVHGPDQLLLASHVTGNTYTIASQKALHEYLSKAYGSDIRRIVLRSGPKTGADSDNPTEDPEVSQRTRSLLFLTIAAIGARRTGMHEVVFIAENGQMAIHLPLSPARIGAFSTHTAHPEFVADAARFFSAVLDHAVDIHNPYLYQTKGEVVAKVASKHNSIIASSNSCWKNARVHGHCGACVPCFVRRISLEIHGIKADPWKRDLFVENVAALPSTDEGKRNLSDLAGFVFDFRNLSDAELDLEYPELNSPYFKRDDALAMYRRFAGEATTVFRAYPNLGHLVT
ncbi:MAG: 7-cyano-7-deazaguanine synthase [Fimbriimonadaceae bacterium]|nr:7-cyano-7-deazaguanine synthase [Fimbriimonadaceae bacterium]